MRSALLDFLSWLVAWTITVLLFPLLFIVSLLWRDHERRVLCDGGADG
jgi:hypothetical protein